MILVLGLFLLLSFVFGWLRYADVKESIQEAQLNYSRQIDNIYQASLNRLSLFYVNRGYANLNSHGIREALEEGNGAELERLSRFRWEVLSQENRYLMQMRFYDTSLMLIASLGDSNLPSKLRITSPLDENPRYGFALFPCSFSYNILIPAYKEGKFLGILEFVVSADYFLKEVEAFSEIRGFIFVRSELFQEERSDLPRSTPLVLFATNQEEPIADEKALAGASLLSKREHEIQGRFFVTHDFGLYSYAKEEVGKLVFFQEVSAAHQKLWGAIYGSFFGALALFLAVIVILHYGFEVLIRRLEESNKLLLQSQTNLQLLNQGLEERVNREIEHRMRQEEESKEKERLLLHQSKLASMGEMIGNIAHQWRQPLTELSAIFIRLEILSEQGTLGHQKLQEGFRECERLVGFMSKTIDDFRGFFVQDKGLELYSINEACKNTLKLLHSALHAHAIEVEIIEEEEIWIKGHPREFAQAILNILGNAKDILLERQVRSPQIKLLIGRRANQAYVRIEDNGGGIELSPVEKIFEPYISTKHAGSGTGIGLYMSKTIIEKNAKGTLSAHNSSVGAVFEIYL